MKTVSTFASLVFLLVFSSLSFAETTSIKAVQFHADWCGSCKAIQPQLDKARGKHGLDDMDVLFVRLDLTDKTTSHQSKLMAESLGLGKLYEENKGKTGYIALVNAKTGEVVGKITKAHKADDMAALIRENLSS